MGVLLRRVVLIALVLSLAACARTVPKISHVHIGHTVSGWRDTPDQQGLFVTAEQEALNAEKEIKAALYNLNDLNTVKSHVKALFQKTGTRSRFELIALAKPEVDALDPSATTPTA